MDTPFIPPNVRSVILKASSILKPGSDENRTIKQNMFKNGIKYVSKCQQALEGIIDAAYQVLCTH